MWNLKPKELQLLGDHFPLELNLNSIKSKSKFKPKQLQLAGDHFPLEARHHLAPWLEANFTTELDLSNPQVNCVRLNITQM